MAGKFSSGSLSVSETSEPTSAEFFVKGATDELEVIVSSKPVLVRAHGRSEGSHSRENDQFRFLSLPTSGGALKKALVLLCSPNEGLARTTTTKQ
jgi:hypothetical protein